MILYISLIGINEKIEYYFEIFSINVLVSSSVKGLIIGSLQGVEGPTVTNGKRSTTFSLPSLTIHLVLLCRPPTIRRIVRSVDTSQPVTVVLVSTVSIQEVVVWLVVCTITVPTWTVTIPDTLVRLVCVTSMLLVSLPGVLP